MSVELHFNGLVAPAAPGETLFACGERLGIPVPTSCKKQGKCKECVVEVTAGMDRLSPPGPEEKHLKGNFRLSCCTRIAAEAGTVRCATMRRGTMKIEKHAFALPTGPRTWQLDPAVTRDGERILLDGVEIDRGTGPLHGLAIDLGTTTIVIRLLNLETGEVIADSSFENPQRFGGSDVMARIQYDTEDRTKTLQRTLTGYLSRAITEFPVDPRSIYEVVLAGNSTMRDLFFRLSVHSIGQSPYQSLTELEIAAGTRTTTTLTDTARRLGLPIHPQARVLGLPIISGHVGADAAACMLAIDLAHEERVVAVMDIGTNTELIVGNRHKVLAASCPAGPAFEGGQITCGMPGLPGAIEKVRLHDDGRVETGVIGDVPAEGLCGSGLVDLLSELRRTGRMNELGRFEEAGQDFVVASDGDRPVTFNESDVNVLAQAKGANVAGLQIAFAEYGIDYPQLDVFYLAGGFGRHLNLESSKRIGLIPNLPADKIVQVGNASVEGACIALLSRAKRAELEALVSRVQHCRLETHPGFFDYFVEGCQFAPVGGTPVAES
ncbi:2Fe-2S iron-sulfur cluster binding domain protein [Lacunisphaera limnophila]|uniref:2Fe-2S iron-sulfur cluster binding domain protein n=1 Tax=Lacunisphaera limnophila TaxID=1838286 RepID=A0A1D8ARR1_9BACT|nr:ASKHA domain-containing protein [Lacunisphaera limnophila]AOS43585.1 2Fe-2S iron-sulfur cluster binding domain protein [Lacunisphaera limnophila]